MPINVFVSGAVSILTGVEEETLVTQHLSGTTLVSGVDRPTWCSGCAIDFTIQLPADVSVVVESGSGSVRLVGLNASASVLVGSGPIEVSDFAGERLDLEAGSGEIVAQGLRVAEVAASTGSGRIQLGFEATPSSVNADTGSGSQAITVPSGSYDVSWHTGSGDFKVDRITLDAAAPFKMRLGSGSGNIVVRGR